MLANRKNKKKPKKLCERCGNMCFGQYCRSCRNIILKQTRYTQTYRFFKPITRAQIIDYLVNNEGFSRDRAVYLVEWARSPPNTPLN